MSGPAGAIPGAEALRRIALATLMARGDGHIEARVEGRSMEPTLAEGSTVRIRPGPGEGPGAGEIVAVAVGPRIIIHRVLRVARGRGSRRWILMRGDGCLLPDPPLATEWIVGRVTDLAVEEPGKERIWKPVGPAPWRGGPRRLAAGSAALVVSLLLRLGPVAAARAAGLLRALGRPARAARVEEPLAGPGRLPGPGPVSSPGSRCRERHLRNE